MNHSICIPAADLYALTHKETPVTIATHPDWLPQNATEQTYLDTLHAIGTARAAGDEETACAITRDILKPMLRQYGGTIPPVRGQILAITARDAQ